MVFTLWTHLLSKLLQLIPNENWIYSLPPALFNLSLTASFVIVAVLLVRLLLRKVPRVYSYFLWAVVAFRLICPISFSSDFSLLGVLDAPVAEAGQVEYVPVTIVHDPHPSVDLIIPQVTDTVNEQLPSSWEQAADPLEWPAALATEIWIAGVGIMLLWALVSYFNLRHKLRTAVLLEGNVFQSEHVGSPFILGLFRPKIYIPFGLDDTTLKYVLAHERYHLKRLDHIVKVFSFILLTIHWFNPLCWLAFHLMSKDMEMSCDEKVLSQNKNIKTEYSTILLSFASNRRFPSPSPLAFGETGAKSRIKNALKWKRPKVWVTVLAAVLCIVVVAACAANPKESNHTENNSPYQWTSTISSDNISNAYIQLSDRAVPHRLSLSSSDIRKLVDILKKIPSESIYTGHGTPTSMSVVMHVGTQKYELLYGGGRTELWINSNVSASGDGIWQIHDEALKEFMELYLAELKDAYEHTVQNAQQPQTTAADFVQWEFGTAFSSLYPGFPFVFTNFAHSHIEATCSAGRLINEQTGEKGQSMTYYAVKETLYWTPDSTNVPSAVIQFTAYDDETAVFSGSILIEQMEGDSLSSVYSARLSADGELTLRKNITGNDGGLIYRIPVHDLTENGPIELGAHLLRNYHFKTNSTKIYFEFDPDIEPFKISLYSTDSETALSSFSLGGGNLASFSVGGLSPDREYYFVAERQVYTLLTIHD